MPVPLFDPSTPLEPLRDELRAAVDRVLDGGAFILGPECRGLRGASSPPTSGVPDAIGVANGTEALTIALRALGVGPGDDVVVPSFTFYASAEAIPPTGARPVFCDIDPATFCVTPDTVRAALTPPRRRSSPCTCSATSRPWREIEALGLPVVEDAAQAAGTTSRDGRPGALGTIATFSFYPSKNLGAFGDGGAVATRDATLADARPHAALPRLAPTRSPTPRWATTRASTSCRPRSCA